MTVLLERPTKSQTKLSIMHRQHKELLKHLAPCEKTRVICCMAKLINYFGRWQDWKKSRYPTEWVYQPLTAIRHDLLDEHSIHVIREALTLLEKLGFLSKRKNNRGVNCRNGQDRTHQYLLHSDRVESALSRFFSESAAETLVDSPFVNSEIPSVNVEIHSVTVDTHTQIPSKIPATDSCSLLKKQGKTNFVRELEDFWEVEDEVEPDSIASYNDTTEILQEEKGSHKNQFSAVPAPKCVEVVQNNVSASKCIEVLQTDVNEIKPLPKLKSESVALLRFADRTSGFRSQEERDGFYQSLLELGKSQGKKSPVAWAAVIVRNVNAGEPCQYLNEYRDGLVVGSCEQQEWEVAPGQPFEQFVSYLKTRNKKTGMSDEEALASSYQQLKDVNLARAQWESCKRSIVRYSEEWEKQKRLGVSNAYLPPELLPHRQVNFKEVESAMASLQTGCVQLLELAESAKLNSATAELEPVKELPSEPAIAEPEPVAATAELEPVKELPSESAIAEPEPVAATAELEQAKELPSEPEPVSAIELQEKLNSPFALFESLGRTMAKALGYRIEEGLVLNAGEEIPSLEHLRSLLSNTETRSVTAKKIQRLIEGNPQWGFYFDEFGELWGF